jgi:two-component system sensor histidine kinase UhpB
MFVLDARGVVAECNRAACAALGLDHKDIAGRDAAELLDGWGETAAFLKDNKTGSLKMGLDTGNQKTTHILNVTHITGDGGEHQGRLLVFHDVSELEERERADRRARQLQELSRGIILAQEEERSRIGRELHDDFGHKFMSLSLKIEALRKKGLVDAKDIEPIENLMSGTSEELMRIYRNLKPTVIEHLGLSAALKSLVGGIESSHDIVAESDIDDFDKEDLEPGMAMGIFRIAQESLTNVVKHSGADTVKVELYKEEDRVCLNIEDNGKGAGPDPRSVSGGMGLIGMSERAAALGGEIQITSGEMGGTRVFLCIPFRAQNEQGGAS